MVITSVILQSVVTRHFNPDGTWELNQSHSTAIGVAFVPPVRDAQQLRFVADPMRSTVVSLRLKTENRFVIDDELRYL